MSRIKNNYKATVSACYIGYITQAIVNNFAPLLFVTFNKEFGVSLDKIASIVSINFGIQLIVDLLSAKIVDKIGYRKMIVAAHIFSAAGLAGLGFFPYIVPSHYVGILIATAFSAIGGGLIEVLISPIVQACPVDAKSSAMSLLHSFYCWGHIFVVLLSTGFFALSGVASWRYLAYIWAIIPILNAMLFSRVTIYPLMAENEKGMTIKELFKSGTFWALSILMTCSGASEQGISQWASAFAEEGLGVSKAVGDLAGPCAFALFMGLARVLHSKIDEKIDLQKFMIFSSLLCICAYLFGKPRSERNYFSHRLRTLRIFSRSYVAWHIQHCRQGLPCRRNRLVCAVGSCGRPRLCARTVHRGAFVKSSGRRPQKRNFDRGYIPDNTCFDAYFIP